MFGAMVVLQQNFCLVVILCLKIIFLKIKVLTLEVLVNSSGQLGALVAFSEIFLHFWQKLTKQGHASHVDIPYKMELSLSGRKIPVLCPVNGPFPRDLFC